MKRLYMLLILAVALAFIGCSKKDDPSPTTAVNERLTAVSSTGGIATLTYDDQGRLTTISSDGDEFDLFYLASDIKGSFDGDPPKGVNDLDLDTDRDVHVYSTTMSNGNPVVLKAYVIEYDYNPNTGQYNQVFNEIEFHVTYDNKVSPLYLVLDQSKMLPTIDAITLGSADPTYASLNAAGLFSVNNPTKVEVFDNAGTLLEPATTITYQYDAAGMPTKAISSDGGVVNFTYTPK